MRRHDLSAPLLTDPSSGTTLSADRAYDSNAIRVQARAQRVRADIPPKRNRKGSFPAMREVAASGGSTALSKTVEERGARYAAHQRYDE